MKISAQEKIYLRDLAKKQLEYSQLPIMQQRKEHWYRHNSLRSDTPIIVIEVDTFAKDILPPLRCQDEELRKLEYQFLHHIINHELIDDDKVVPDYAVVAWDITFKLFDLDIQQVTSDDESSGHLGRTWVHPLRGSIQEIESLKPSAYEVDRQKTAQRKAFYEDLIGDILPVKIENRSMHWIFCLTAHVVYLMGMENMLMLLMDNPSAFKLLMTKITDDLLGFVKWQENEGLLTLNNENHYVGSGSYGFTTELPVKFTRSSSWITTKDLWCNMNSQESVGLSPSMYEEFLYPHYQKVAREFGLVYYGCCEPVDGIWDRCLRYLPNLRKVSISPWCNETLMGQKLRGCPVIYSRKPDPKLIGMDQFDEEGYREHIKTTLKAAQGCGLEIIHRDIYTLNGDRTRAGRAVKIARQMIEKFWK